MEIHLINMPFAAASLPSIALTQIKSVVTERFKEQVSVHIHYLNHDFAQYMGIDLYTFISNSMDAHNSGLGDWFFRQAAFPELADNTEAYFRRYFPYRSPQFDEFRRVLLEKRRGLDQFLGQLIETYKLNGANLVGFTSMFNQNIASFALARKIKESNPDTVMVLGGANCEAPMGQEIAKHVRAIDFVFSGPALKSFPELVRHLLNGEAEQCGSIKGVFTKTNYALLSAQAAIGEELDIDVPVELDYGSFIDGVESRFPNGEVKPVLLFETSRGCWWGQRAHCTFCGLNGTTMAYRSMSPSLALDQFKSLFKYAPKISRFESVDNIVPKHYMKEVFPELETPSSAYLFYEVKADLSEQDVEVLSKARVKVIQPGIESLATSTLKLMKKGTTAFQNLFLLKQCLMYDVFPVWNLLVGFPGEEDDVYRKYVRDLPLLFHLPPPNGSFPVRFDRYSPYFVKAKEYELDLQPVDYYELGYPFDKESLSNLAYYFEDRNVSARYMKLMLRWIDKIREKVNLWLTRWYVQDGLSRPQLYFKENSTVVFDSRSGSNIEHQIGDVGQQVLAYLSPKPARAATVAEALNHLTGLDFTKEIASLQAKGLVFQEGDRYMSLVLPKEPPPMSFQSTEH